MGDLEVKSILLVKTGVNLVEKWDIYVEKKIASFFYIHIFLLIL